MDAETLYRQLKEIALTEFSEAVTNAFLVRGPLNFPRCLFQGFLLGDKFDEIGMGGEDFYGQRGNLRWGLKNGWVRNAL